MLGFLPGIFFDSFRTRNQVSVANIIICTDSDRKGAEGALDKLLAGSRKTTSIIIAQRIDFQYKTALLQKFDIKPVIKI